jgi:hypothetical protein
MQACILHLTTGVYAHLFPTAMSSTLITGENDYCLQNTALWMICAVHAESLTDQLLGFFISRHEVMSVDSHVMNGAPRVQRRSSRR